ncbi:HYR-like domain-containing protein [Formosa sp. S-31]|uniref:HYR-like domain-containing protein n=1 Tax=Formosa sp. S-31 TaxID=2790949 RepID=UPI003EC0E605
MKKLYPTPSKAYKNRRKLPILAFLLLFVSFYGYSQVIKPFTPRASASTGQTVYNVRGNFAIIGNTNLTLETYENDVTDSDPMIYVDVDNDPNTLNSSEATLEFLLEDGTASTCGNILYAGLYWTGRSELDDQFTVTKDGVTKNFNKRTAYIKGPSGSYQAVTASADNILYPQGEYANMFSAYADVTDFVKTNGPGAYTVADLALLEGLGGNTGYFGGWSMVVVYENSEMKRRNISVFDGYAYQLGRIPSYSYITLDVSELNKTQAGNIDVNFGLMAGEGDFSLDFDYFEMYKGEAPDVANNPIPFPDSAFQRLAHGGQAAGTQNNFFNSSIATTGSPRNPSLWNNTGMDLVMFHLPNGNNTLVDQNQEKVLFRYSALQDSYIIYNLTMAFLAPEPEIEAEVEIVSIDGTPAGAGATSVLPGQDITYKVEVKNFGEEASTNTMLSIPVPFNTTYNNVAITYTGYPPYTANTAPYYDAATNSILWDLNNVTQTNRTDNLIADLTFTVSATTDCSILAVDCADLISMDGNISGTGLTSGIDFNKTFITGVDYSATTCVNTFIPAPLETTIDADQYIIDNCGAVTSNEYYFCNYSGSSIPVSQVSGDFPPGTRFYNEFPLTASSIEYNILNPFPATTGEITYYAIPPGAGTCALEFTLHVDSLSSTPTVSPTPVEYCLNAAAVPLTATASDPSLILYFYTDNNPSTTGQTSLTPNTDTPGTFTYYVAEGSGPDCISPNRVPITVVIHDVLNISSNITDASCTPGNDGAIDLTVTGGSGNYSYVWSTGATTEDITGLATGNYTVTITDTTTGCDTVSSFTIERDDDALPTITAPAAYAIEACDTSVALDLAFSTTPVSITLSDLENAQGGGGTATGFSSISYSDVQSGTCPVTITRTFTVENDCNNTATATQIITLEDNTAPTVPNAPADVTIECSDALPLIPTLTATDNCPGSGPITGVLTETTNNADPCNVTVTRTWTFTDDCGNADSISQVITIVDTTPPVITGTPINLIIECDGLEKSSVLEQWFLINANTDATDNCSEVTWSNDFNEEDLTDCSSLVDVTFTATDACDNSSSFMVSVEIRDNTGPDVVDAQDASFECGDTTGIQDWLDNNGGALATDNCSEIIEWTNDYAGITPTCGNSGSATVTFTATDSCGNPTTTTATLTITDTTAPVAPAAPADITVECITDVPTAETLTATDSCSGDINATGIDSVDNTDPCNVIITRTWTFTDPCGNPTEISQTINVIDNTAPVASAAPADVTVECISDLPAMTDLTATDNCLGDITVTGVDSVNNDNPCNVIVTRTWTFTDACNNTTVATQTINVIDTTAPVAPAAPANITVDCLDNLPTTIELSAIDNCGGTVTATGVDDITPGDSCSEIITRTWTFTDACGNSSTATQTITIMDDVPPVFTTPAQDIVYYCTGNERTNPAAIEAWITIYGGAIAEDNCSGTNLTWTNDYDADLTACGDPIPVTFTATDACGNSTSTTATYTIIDTTAPVITTEPQDISIDCENTNGSDLQNWLDSSGGAMAEDYCSDTVTWTNDFNANLINGACGASGAITVTFTATDNCGNAVTTTASITVTDTVAPTVPSAPADVTVECIDDIPAMIDLTATDNCGGDIVATGVDSVNNTDPCNVVVTRTWTFTDPCGNTAEVSQTINVIDTTAPTLPDVPADITIDCSADLPAMINLTATDNCGDSITATPVDSIDDTDNCNVVVTRTWTFTDTCGNTSEAVQIITVKDETGPTITSPAQDIVYYCNGEERNPVTIDAWVVIQGGALAEDNCSDVTWTNNYDPNLLDCGNPIEVIFTATDACGNVSTTSATYTIIDVTGPQITQEPTDIVFECDATSGTELTDWLTTNGGATASDQCSVALSWSNDFDMTSLDGVCGADNAVTVTFTVTDNCGNATSTTATITIIDDIAPELPTNIPADVTVECMSDVPAMTDLTATDICAGDITVSGIDTEDNSDPTNVIITRTWTFTDACGNTTEATQTITVQDATAPIVDTTVEDLTLDCIDDVPALADLTATDNCAGTITASGTETIETIDDCHQVITRNWVFTDNSGNTTEVTQVITVNDDEAPVPDNAPEDLALECFDDVPALADLTATDNCAGTITSEGIETVDDADPTNITIVRTWIFTDDCGNTAEVSQTITVQDNSAPVVDTTVEDLTLDCIDDVPALADLTATDNCAGTITASGTETIETIDDCHQVITRNWVFTDNSGNSTEVTQVITVNDDEAPVVDTTVEDLTLECMDDVPALADLTATDNCAGTITSAGVETIDDTTDETVITRTWTFTDACGNTTEVSQTITVQDITAPVADSTPEDITVACIDDVPALTELTATDNCSGTITASGSETVNDADSCNITITRTWTFEDAAGNITDVTQVIMVIDDVAPTATAPADVTVECIESVPEMIDLTATDNCGAEITATGVDSVNEIDGCSSIITRTWTFTDACGNTSEVSQIITVADETAPTLDGDFDTEITVNCAAIPDQPTLSFTDNCSADLTVVYNEINTSTGADNENYQVIRDWTVSDACGNTTVFTQTINVNVQQLPVELSDDKCVEGGDINLDSYLEGSTDGTWVVEAGDATLTGSTFDPLGAELGDYVFRFKEATGCLNETVVTISLNDDCVIPPCDPQISDAVTPNGDQYNEYFTITGIESCGYGDIAVEIYNRWGALVFKSENYQNNWNGQNDKKAFGGSDHLPTGTYYYIVTFKNSGLKPKTGPLYLGTK